MRYFSTFAAVNCSVIMIFLDGALLGTEAFGSGPDHLQRPAPTVGSIRLDRNPARPVVRFAAQRKKTRRPAPELPRQNFMQEVARIVREPMGRAFTPDGEQVVLTYWTWDFTVVDLASGKERLSMGAGERPIVGEHNALSAAIAVSDSEIVFGHADQMVRVRSLRTGEKVRAFEPFPLKQEFDNLLYSRSGKWVVGRGRTEVRVWDVPTGKELERYPLRTLARNAIDLHPNGSLLVVIDQNRVFHVLNPLGGMVQTSFPDPIRWLSRVRFSPEGRQLLCSTDDHPEFVLLSPLNGAIQMNYVGHTGNAVDADFFPDRPWIVSVAADRTLQVWDRTTGTTLFAKSLPADPRRVGVSPTGKYLVLMLKDEMIFYRLNYPAASPPAKRGARAKTR